MDNNIYCIKNAQLIDLSSTWHGQSPHIYFDDEKIIHIGDKQDLEAQYFDMAGLLISPGWIDIHTHCYTGVDLGVNPDRIGYQQGVCTVIDAGSTGANTAQDFIDTFGDYQTQIKLFLNIASDGLKTLSELKDNASVDIDKSVTFSKKNREHIVGWKLRASSSVMGDNYELPFEKARVIANSTKLPILVHVGNAPPDLSSVIDKLESGDIVTHSFHGKKGGIIQNGCIIPSAIQARNKGVYFDIGHGQASFDFNVYENATKLGFGSDSISSDLHNRNIDSIVFSLHCVMEKLVALGMDIDEVIRQVSSAPAHMLKLDRLGSIKLGYKPNFTLFQIKDCDKMAVDSDQNELIIKKEFVPKTVFINGKKCEI